jgi:hypothetical protein
MGKRLPWMVVGIFRINYRPTRKFERIIVGGRKIRQKRAELIASGNNY